MDTCIKLIKLKICSINCNEIGVLFPIKAVDNEDIFYHGDKEQTVVV